MKRLFSILIILACMLATMAQQEYPMPQIPDSIIDAQERAAHATLEYWQMADTATFANNGVEYAEQAIANYAYLLSVAADKADVKGSADALWQRIAANEKAAYVVIEYLETYLYDLKSPFSNENAYAIFAQSALNNGVSGALKSKLEYQLVLLAKNRPGAKAEDFAIILRSGNESTLLSETDGEYALVLFYDPDCDDCHKTMEEIKRDKWFSRCIADGKFRIVAIAMSDTREAWEMSKAELPENWVVACELADIVGNDLYDIRDFPTLYLLDERGTVVMRNRPLIDNVEALYEHVKE